MSVPTRTRSSKAGHEGVAELDRLTLLVEQVNVCALPGCAIIKYDSFLTVMWRAVARGCVKHDDAVFVARGLRRGFEAGVGREELCVQRIFKHCRSAVDAMPHMTEAVHGQIGTGKSIAVGGWGFMRDELRLGSLGDLPNLATMERWPNMVIRTSSAGVNGYVDGKLGCVVDALGNVDSKLGCVVDALWGTSTAT